MRGGTSCHPERQRDTVRNFGTALCLFFFPPDLFDSRRLMPVDKSASLDSSFVKHACTCDFSCPHTCDEGS